MAPTPPPTPDMLPGSLGAEIQKRKAEMIESFDELYARASKAPKIDPAEEKRRASLGLKERYSENRMSGKFEKAILEGMMAQANAMQLKKKIELATIDNETVAQKAVEEEKRRANLGLLERHTEIQLSGKSDKAILEGMMAKDNEIRLKKEIESIQKENQVLRREKEEIMWTWNREKETTAEETEKEIMNVLLQQNQLQSQERGRADKAEKKLEKMDRQLKWMKEAKELFQKEYNMLIFVHRDATQALAKFEPGIVPLKYQFPLSPLTRRWLFPSYQLLMERLVSYQCITEIMADGKMRLLMTNESR